MTTTIDRKELRDTYLYFKQRQLENRREQLRKENPKWSDCDIDHELMIEKITANMFDY